MLECLSAEVFQAIVDRLETGANKARREGLIALESDVEEPEKSPIFSKNPSSERPSRARFCVRHHANGGDWRH